MQTWREKAAAAKAEAQAILTKAADEGREPEAEELTKAEQLVEAAKAALVNAEQAERVASLVGTLAKADTGPDEDGDETPAKGGLGSRFVKSAAFQGFRKSHPSGIGEGTPLHLEVKGIGSLADIGMKATLDTTFGELRAERQPGYRDYLPAASYVPPSILDLITVGTTTSRSLEYAQVTAETNNAAIVAEGALKPLSDLTTDVADAKVFTYADGFDATNQFLADEPALATFMDGAVRRHLRMLIEDRLLNGAGGASAPRGILNTTGVQAQAFVTDVITTIAAALEKVEDVNAEAQAIVMNTADAWALRRLKDTTGQYLSGGPFGAAVVQTLWGVPVVPSRRVVAGTALVGNFRTVNFLQREPISVLAFNQHKDYAQRNMVYVRAELRAMQLVYAPREIVVADLTA